MLLSLTQEPENHAGERSKSQREIKGGIKAPLFEIKGGSATRLKFCGKRPLKGATVTGAEGLASGTSKEHVTSARTWTSSCGQLFDCSPLPPN